MHSLSSSIREFKAVANYNYKTAAIKNYPEVSIVTPFFNTGSVFEETVNCVMTQSFQNFEWIIINDCSEDSNSLELLHKLSRSDKRIKVLNNRENIGPAGSRNAGIKAAKGNYIFFVDSDDLLEPTIIEKYWLFLEVNDEYMFCNAWHVGFGAENYEWVKGFECGINMLKENPIQPTFLARKSLFNKVAFDEAIREGFEDWDFWLRCAANGYWGFTIPEYLYWYRRSENIVDKWKSWDFGEKMEKFKRNLALKYSNSLEQNFPSPDISRFTKGEKVKTLFEDKLYINKIAKSSKKRMLFIVPWLAMGGADKFNLDLIKGLADLGWEITLVTTKKSNNAWLEEFLAITQDIFILPNYSEEYYFSQLLEYLISSREPDCILLSNSELGYQAAPLLKMKFPNIPLVDYNHMEESYWNNGGHPKQSVIYQAYFNNNIVSSNHLKNWMIKQGATAEKINVVYTASDYLNIKPDNCVRRELRDKWGANDDLCVITFSGRLTDQKQPFVMLKAIFELNKVLKDGYVLAVAGDGPDFEPMKRWAQRHNISDKIWFLGAISNKENIKVLQASDVFFLPSLWEGISLAIYEAMTVGLPIVGADVGGQRELVTKGCGYLAKRSTPDQEAAEYAKILEILVKDKSYRALLGKTSRLRIEADFGIHLMHENIDSILSKSIKNCKGAKAQLSYFSFHQLLSTMLYEKKVADQLWEDNVYLQSSSKHFDSTVNYYNDYEKLPLWYKRFGHVLKALKGKRSFKSLVFDKYKLNPTSISHHEWYSLEYETLPQWYKKFGRVVNVVQD